MKRMCLVIFMLAALTSAATAAIIGVDLGTGAPPGTLGGYTMIGFAPSGVIDGTLVGSLPTPIGGVLGFTGAVTKYTVGATWATWSHGYAGEVFWTGGATSLLMTLPAGASAFLFYAEPNPFAVFTITATANDGTFLSIPVDGSGGANGFGFYGTGATTIASISVSSSADFAVGEFAIAGNHPVPEPSLCLLLGIALGAICLVTRRFMA
jgi:hypothetical protein